MKKFYDIKNGIASSSDNGLLVVAVSMSVVIKTILLINSHVVNDDAVRYANAAYQLMQGNWSSAFSHEIMLSYAFLLGLVHFLTNDWGLAGQLISVTFLTLTIFPLYYLTKELFGTRPALWTVVAFNLIPAFNELAAEVVKDAPYLFFMTTALCLGCRPRSEPRFSNHLLVIGCIVLATLFRFEAVVLLGLYFLWLLFQAVFHPASRAHAFNGLLLYVGMLAVCVGVVAGLLFFGAMEIATVKSIYLRFSEHYLKPDLFRDYRGIYGYLKAGEHNFAGGQWSNDFFEIARHFMPVIYLLGLLQIIGTALSPVYLVPLCLGLWALNLPARNIGLLLWTVVVYVLLGYFFIMTRNFLSERYVLVVVILLLPIAGHGFEQLVSRLIASKHQKVFASFVVALFLILPIYKSFAEASDEKIEIRSAADWLKSNTDAASSRMATTDERVPFYAGLYREHYEILSGQGTRFDLDGLKRNCSLLVVDVPLQDRPEWPVYENFALVKMFPGKKRAVLIYEKIHPL